MGKGAVEQSIRLPTAPAGPSFHTRIVPSGGWFTPRLGELWAFRELLYFLAWRDVKVRYKQTALGAAWAVLQPAMLMVVFTVVFGRMVGLSSGGLPYPLFAFVGLLPWTCFATAITSAGNSVVGSERLITKIYFPRLLIPFSAVAAAVMDFAIAFAMLLVIAPIWGIWPTPQILLVVPLLGILLLAALGLGTFLAALNVRYRDFRYALPFLIQVGMFATPSVYMQRTGSEEELVSLLLDLNPLTGLIEAFRAAVLGGEVPWAAVAVSGATSAALFAAGCVYFRRVEDGFADII